MASKMKMVIPSVLNDAGKFFILSLISFFSFYRITSIFFNKQIFYFIQII